MPRKPDLADTAAFAPSRDGSWRWKCYFTRTPHIKVDDVLADTLRSLGIEYVPDGVQFMRIASPGHRYITYRDNGGTIFITVIDVQN